MAQRVTRANLIHVALEAHRQKDLDALEAAKADCERLYKELDDLSLEVLLKHPMGKTIRKLCPGAHAFISKQSFPNPRIYKLTWDNGSKYEGMSIRRQRESAKSTGEILLTGNPRKRAVNLYKKLETAQSRKDVARDRVARWHSRKKEFLKQRLHEHPDLLERVQDICSLAFKSEPFLTEEDPDPPKPGPLPIKGGIDSGKMWVSQSIGHRADPKVAAKVLIECFNEQWIHELRKELHLQSNLK